MTGGGGRSSPWALKGATATGEEESIIYTRRWEEEREACADSGCHVLLASDGGWRWRLRPRLGRPFRISPKQEALARSFLHELTENLTDRLQPTSKSPNRKMAVLPPTQLRKGPSEIQLKNPMSTRSITFFAFLKLQKAFTWKD